MSFRGKNFICWLWIGALLSATVGISVHKLYCYCVGKTTVTLFAASADDACAKRDGASLNCCEKPAVTARPSCCQQKADTAPGIHSKCTDEKTEVFQLREEFLTEHPTAKTLDCPAWLAELPMFKRFFRPALCRVERSLLPPDFAGPPLSGRDICVRDQVFRI